jgi:hypothetical protein
MRIWYKNNKIFTTQTDRGFIASIWRNGKEILQVCESIEDAKYWIDKQLTLRL